MSRTLFSTSVKSPRSLARASAASTAFWACCSKRTKNSLFFGKSDRRTVSPPWTAGHILPDRSGESGGGRRRGPIPFARQGSVTAAVRLARRFRPRRDVWRNKGHEALVHGALGLERNSLGDGRL